MRIVKVMNMTSLFRREMLIYSFFDVRLQSPVRVMTIFYFIVLFAIFGVPTFMLFWPPNPYSLMFAVGVPLGGAILMGKPIWNGKSFVSFAKTQIRYFLRPKKLYDWKPRTNKWEYEVESNILVSRHKDYNKLYLMVKEEKKGGKR